MGRIEPSERAPRRIGLPRARPTAGIRLAMIVAGSVAGALAPDDWQRAAAFGIALLAVYLSGYIDGRRERAVEFLLRRDHGGD